MLTFAQIFPEVSALYFERGSKFTMDEVAARLCISKKTLYEMVRSKEELAVRMVDFYFEKVAALQDAIHMDETIPAVEKLRRLLCATPDFPMRRYHLHEMKMNFPQAYQSLDGYLRQGWERTLGVLQKARSEGAIRDIDEALFSRLYSAAIEDLLAGNEVRDEREFRLKQAEIVDMLLFGICK